MLKQLTRVALFLATISSFLAIPATPAVAAETPQGIQAGGIDVTATQAASANVNGRLNVKHEDADRKRSQYCRDLLGPDPRSGVGSCDRGWEWTLVRW